MIDRILPAIAGAKASIITGLACVAICLPLGYCKGESAANAHNAAARAAANVEALTTARTADEKAGVERVSDALANVKLTEGLTDAIADTPDSAPDATRVALGCFRLRAQGTGTTSIPACSGREGAH